MPIEPRGKKGGGEVPYTSPGVFKAYHGNAHKLKKREIQDGFGKEGEKDRLSRPGHTDTPSDRCKR